MRLSYADPALPFFLLISLVGLVSFWRRSAPARRPWLLTIGIVGMLLLSMNAVAWLVSRPLEARYETDNPLPRESADAIVILAGEVHEPSVNEPYPLAAQDTYERVEHGLWLFKHWRSVPILVCGGTIRNTTPYSTTMRGILVSQGIPSEMIWTEDRSASTHENAVFGARILRDHGVSQIALIVEANSMLRAADSFRKQGLNVVPVAIRFTTMDLELNDILPGISAIGRNNESLHEYLGLLWYRLHGWI